MSLQLCNLQLASMQMLDQTTTSLLARRPSLDVV
jgi:hypothetical protein